MGSKMPSQKHALVPKITAAIAGLIIVGAAGYAAYVYMTHPSSLGSLLFAGLYESGNVIEGGVFGWDEKNIAVTGSLSDFARSGKSTVAIVRNNETGAQDVHLLSPASKILTSDGVGKAAVALSEDGMFVAFSQRTDMSVGSEFAPHISAWQVVVMNTASGEMKNYGEGFAPQFFTKDKEQYVLFTTRKGVTIINTTTLASRSIVFINPGVVDYSAIVSSDGAYLAVPNGVTRILDVFTLSLSATDSSVSLLGIAPVAFVHSAFVGSSIEGIARNEDGSFALHSIDPKQPTLSGNVYVLPDAPYYRIIK
jgi:roadblock/LC7 domain-containing protein